jgi:hypothetical protein
MKLHDFLQLSVFVFSVLAACFWLQSTSNRLAEPSNDAEKVETDLLRITLINQSRWIAAGAACAGLAAFAESLAAVLPYLHLH